MTQNWPTQNLSKDESTKDNSTRKDLTKNDFRIQLLIVDDEQTIRRLCMTVGESLGFSCLEAESGDAEPADLDEADRSLIAALADSARATYPQLAAATGLASSTAKRRLDRLLAEGIVLICTEFPPRRLGYRLMSYLWLRVDPARLDHVGTALAGHTPISFAAAVTGPHNMVAAAI